MKNLNRALEIGARLASAAENKNHILAVITMIDIMNYYETGKITHLWKNVSKAKKQTKFIDIYSSASTKNLSATVKAFTSVEERLEKKSVKKMFSLSLLVISKKR